MTELVRRVARNAAWLALGEGAVKGALFLTAVIVAHGSGPEGMGTFSIAYAAALLAVLALAAGQQEVVIREVAATPGSAGGLLNAARQVQMRLAWWVIPAAVLGSLLVDDRVLRASLLAFIPYALLRAVMVTHGAMFKGLDRMDMEVRARAIEVAVVLPLLAAAAFLAAEIWTAGLAFTAGSAAGLLWLAGRSRRFRGGDQATPEGETFPTQAPPLRRTLRFEGLPFLALALLSQLLLRADTFLLAALSVPRPEIGFYGAAGAPVWGVIAVPQLLAMSLYPTLSRAAAEKERALPAISAATGGGLIVGFLLAAFLYLVRHPLVDFAFGADFAAAVPLLSRLIWVLPATVTMTFLGTVLAAWHQQRWALGVLVAVLLVSICLNLMWIPKYGPMGAATAAVSAQWFGAAVLLALTVALLARTGAKE